MNSLTGSAHQRAAWSEKAVYVAGLLVALLVTTTPVDDHDTFWHLAAGKLILDQGLPTQNTFSFTHPTYPWRSTEWLFDVTLYLLQTTGGFAVLSLFCAAIFGLTAIVMLDTGRRLSGRLAWSHLLPLSAVLLFSRSRASPRPQLFTFLFLALLANLWLRKRNPRVRLLAAVIGAAWANLHAGVVFGTALLLLLLAGLACDHLLDGAGRASRADLVAGGSLALWFIPSTFLSPSLAYPYLYSFKHLGVQQLVDIEEFARAGLESNALFFLFAAVLLLLLPRLARDVRFQAAFSAAPFFLLAWRAVRIIPKFGIVAGPFLMLSLSTSTPRPRLRIPSPRLAAAGLLLAATVVIGIRDLTRWPPALGLDASDFPVGATEFLKKSGLRGNFYNDFDDGGYLIYALYPGMRVFQDGRVPYYPEAFWKEIRTATSQERWEALLERYGVIGAIIKRRPGSYDYSAFVSADAWNLVYRDENSFIFLKKPAPVPREDRAGERR